MKVFLGSDHQGYGLKAEIKRYLEMAGYQVEDDGDEKLDPNDDFPVFASRVCKDILVSGDPESRGILLCGSGQGMCITANRFKGIRACMGYDLESIRSARNDDDCNVLCLPAKFITKENANVFVETFLNTDFAAAPRYKRRIEQIDELT
jgi:ribose 5-phosphate isomerase B